ncbi:MAG: hypothetical protein U9N51_10570 [Bacteroidota bacterium]|nr:hypothetical protein [Bacteroidota bacterium]
MRNLKLIVVISLSTIFIMSGCAKKEKLEVIATAYNSLPEQTHKEHYNVGAWGDTLKPGMKCIAVSRDLIELGLKHNTKVEIEGLSGTYRVLDKMNKRWEKKIDIYMGSDKEAAIQWGKKKVIINWKKE